MDTAAAGTAAARLMAARRLAFFAFCAGACWAGSQPSANEAGVVVSETQQPAFAVAELREICTPLWEYLSSECMAALDGIYLHRDVTRNRHSQPRQDPAEGDKRPWVPLPLQDRIVWRDVFDNPLELRKAVDDASADSRCLVVFGEARHRLREACAADAFARLSVLHGACGRALYWDGSEYHDGWAAEWEWERRHLAEHAPPEQFAQRKATLDESELHFAWRLAKCRDVPGAAMERVVSLQRPHYRLGIQDSELLIVAARLGSVWANTQLGGVGEELNATARESLALAYLRRAAALGPYDSQPMYLPYLLVARQHDLRGGALLDWSRLEQWFSEAALHDAQPAFERLMRQGWQPMQEERPRTYITRPWAIAPPVVDIRYIRRRLDESGNMRWLYESGTEEWIDANGANRILNPDGSELIIYHGPLQDRQQPHLRSWLDENGRRRWLDVHGVEHWMDADGAEHWIDFAGTEWILLPVRLAHPLK